ncbi:MAG: hypothetical protein HYT08_01465 [Candidatus Levybacteria bacterium]|nr:hypothetical protein [Candidatus Levybacteria bacterium]
MVKKYLVWVLLIIFPLIGGFPLLYSGLIPTHDGEYHIVRFYEFYKVLADGNLYPRWAPDLNFGLGVPLFNYVYPLPNYIASFLHLLGISFINAFKLNMFMAYVFGAISFYLWSKEFWGKLGGVVGAIFYSFSPYFFVDIYIRGSVGEVWALGLFPVFLWAVTKAIFRDEKIFIAFSGLILALIIFAHNILAFAFFPFVLSYMLLLSYLGNNIITSLKNSVAVIFLGLGLASIFWIPAIFELKYVTGLQIFDVKRNFAEIYQLIIPSWGSGFFGTGGGNEMSVQIGIANIFAVLASIVLLVPLLKRKDKKFKILLFFLIWFFLSVLLITKFSISIWDFFPLMNYFQFPWRFLSIVMLTASFMAGSLFSVYHSKILAGIIIFLVFLLGIGYARPAHYFDREDNYYLTRSNFMDGTNSPGNLFNTNWINGSFSRSDKKISINKNHGEIFIKKLNPSRYLFEIKIKEKSEIIVNTAYFPGWYVTIDNRPSALGRTENGLIKFLVPRGKHVVELKFGNTSVRNFAEALSLISFVIFTIIIFKNFRYKII